MERCESPDMLTWILISNSIKTFQDGEKEKKGCQASAQTDHRKGGRQADRRVRVFEVELHSKSGGADQDITGQIREHE